MNKTLLNENGHLTATVSFGAEEIGKAQDKAINKLVLDVTVPGFRKGKAPREQAMRYLSAQKVGDGTINALLRMFDNENAKDEEFSSYVKENKLSSLFQPDVKLEKFTDTEAQFVITWVLNPTVSKLGAYTGLKSDATLRTIKDTDVEAELNRLANDNADLVEQDKEAEMGDTANIDFVGLMNGQAFEGGSAKSFDLELGSKRFVPGFEEQIVSHKAGDKFDVALTMPENYPAPLTGKAVVFKVTLNSVKVKEVPAIDDDFATTLSGKYVSKDLAELKEKIKAELTKTAEENYKNTKINSYLLQIRDASEYVIAPEYLNARVEEHRKSDEASIENQGLTLDEYLKLTNNNLETYMNDLKAHVEAEIKNSLVYEALCQALEIPYPTQKDIEDQIHSPLNEFVNNYTNYLKAAKVPEESINAQVNNYINSVFSSILTAKVQAKILELNEGAKKEKPAAKKPRAKKAAPKVEETAEATVEVEPTKEETEPKAE